MSKALERERSDYVKRWLAFAGFGRKSFGHFAHDLPLFVRGLTSHEPIVREFPELARSTDERHAVMQSAISSVLVCLRRARTRTIIDQTGAQLDYLVDAIDLSHFAADLLNERGHAWLGEPLALWLLGEEHRDRAVALLLARLPVLPEFAEWARADAAALTVRVSTDADPVTIESGGYGRAFRFRSAVVDDVVPLDQPTRPLNFVFTVDAAGETQHVAFNFDDGRSAAANLADAINEQCRGVSAAVAANGNVILTSPFTEASTVEIREPQRQCSASRPKRDETPWQVRAGARRRKQS